MEIEEFEMLKKALSNDEIDIALLKEIVLKQTRENGSVSPMLQNFAFAILSGDETRIIKEAHMIRSVAKYIPVKYVWDSEYFLGIRK